MRRFYFIPLYFLLCVVALAGGLPPKAVGPNTDLSVRSVSIGSSGPIVSQSDCSTITSGLCIDSDDHQIYRWDGDSVENISGAGTDEVVYQSDCSTIINGLCMDTDDGYLYYWNNSAVVQLYPQSGALLAANNLSDVGSAATARSNLGLGDAAVLDASTMTDTYLCIYTTTNGLVCNTDPSSIGGIWETTARTSAPGTPAEKIFYLADNSSWDPSTVAGTVPYWVIYDGANYVAIMDIDGQLLISEEHLGQATYAATASISSAHMYGWKIDNYGQSAAAVLTLPSAADAEMNALFEVVDTNYALYVCPPSGGAIRFKAYDGSLSTLDADDCVGYASGSSIGEEIRITTYQTGSSTYAYKIAVTIGTSFVDSGDQ